MYFAYCAAAALIPLIIGFIWYNPKVFGKAWMNAAGLTEKDLEGANMIKIFGLTYLFSFLLAVEIGPSVIHQMGMNSLMVSELQKETPDQEMLDFYDEFNEKFGEKHRSFGHGVFHGILGGLLWGLGLIGITALFERRSFKYIFLHLGYWVICTGLIGGVLAQFAPTM